MANRGPGAPLRSVRPAWIATVLLALPAMAQTGAPGLPAGESQLRVQVLNGRTGRPVVNTHLLLIGDDGLALDGSRDNPGVNTDVEGYAPLPASPRSRQLHLYVTGYLPCTRASRRTFALELMATRGIVSSNECSPRIRLFPQRGLLVVFVRPEHWWEALRH